MKKREEKKDRNFLITGADGGSAFSMAVFLPLLFAVAVQFALIVSGLSKNESFINGPVYKYIGYLMTPLALFFCLLYILFRDRLDFSLAVGFKRCDKKYYLLAFLLLIGALFSLSWLNEGFIRLIEKVTGNKVPEPKLPGKSPANYVLCLVLIAFLPAFFEECIFRGIILNSVRRLGDFFAVLSVGILFSLYHRSPAQTVYQFIMGASFALIAIKSGSILPSMLIHFLNNAYILTGYFFLPENFAFPLWLNWTLGIAGLLFFVGSILYLVFKCSKPDLDKELCEGYAKVVNVKNERKMFWMLSLAGIAGCLILWVLELMPAAA